MKKEVSEPDFIGDQDPLTKKEEIALAKYFAEKKKERNKKSNSTLVKTKNRKALTA